ncbi:MAG: hypothetical protein K1X94_08305 [Sandaracinaceae bacterium]|nr:hypothetical protein [Sandaracinaceae bacterium]
MRFAGLVLGLFLLGCQGNPRVTIRVQSGLRAGSDLRRVDVTVFEGALGCPPSGASSGGGSLALDGGDQTRLEAGTLTVAELALPQGVYTIHAQGLVADRVVRRCLTVTLVHDRVARVPLSVSCLDVSCPAPSGTAAFSECLNGHCVDPRCDLDDPNTTMYCCDRADPLAQCDVDRTICAASADCRGELACLGPSRCVSGVCIEGEDSCPAGQHCAAASGGCVDDATFALDAGDMDAGALDAAVPPGVDADLDAPASPDASVRDDAFVPFDVGESPDAFVSPLDAWAPDALTSLPDAWAPDAWAVDAWAADAFVGPDAAVTMGGPEGSCIDGLDGDSDHQVDCEDADCAALAVCRGLDCLVSRLVLDPMIEGVPSGPIHWWRTSTNLATLPSSTPTVCGWRDAIAGLVMRPASTDRAPTVVLDAVHFAPGQLVTALDAMALPSSHARTIVAMVRETSPGLLHVLSTGDTTRTAAVSLIHAPGGYAVEVAGSRATASGPLIGGLRQDEILRLSTGPNYATSDLTVGIGGMPRTFTDPMEVPPFFAPDRETIGGRLDTGTFEVSEILVYDRVLSGSELAQLESYLGARYP